MSQSLQDPSQRQENQTGVSRNRQSPGQQTTGGQQSAQQWQGQAQQLGGQQPGGQELGGQHLENQQAGGQQPGGTQVPVETTQQQSSGQYLGQLFQTQSHLPEQVRTTSIEHLNRCLADTTVLMTQAKFAHWNVKGMAFVGLHELFDELADVLEDHVDLLAERATALGGEALGTARMAARSSKIPPLPPGAVSGVEFVQLLVERLAIHDAHLGQDIDTASESGDVDTADLLNEVSREVSKYRWFLEAHLQDPQQTHGQTGRQPTPMGSQPGAGPTQQ